MNELSLTEEKYKITNIIHLKKDLSGDTVNSLKQKLEETLKKHSCEFVLIDCTELSSIDLKGYQALIEMTKLYDNEDKVLGISSIPEGLSIDQCIAKFPKYYKNKELALTAFEEEYNKKSSTNLVSNLAVTLKLTILAGPEKGTVYLKPEDKEITIGRHSSCKLSLPGDIKTSRFHSKIYQKDGIFYLEDLKSSNGTTYEGKMIDSPVSLKNGSRFQVGDTYLEATMIYKDTGPLPSTTSFSMPSLDSSFDDYIDDNLDNIATDSLWPSYGMETKITFIPPEILASEETLRLRSPKEFLELNEQYQKKKESENIIKNSNKVFSLTKIPIPLKRSKGVPPKDIIENRYEIIKTIGNSSSSFMYYCKDLHTYERVYIQYTKEKLLLKPIKHKHPNLLVADSHEELDNAHLFVFKNTGEVIENLPLPELKAIETCIVLVDILLFLESSGISEFDIDPSHMFFDENLLPKFALLSTPIYEKTSGKKADIFTIGATLLELSTGIKPPYTPMGTLDEDKLNNALLKISKPLALLILEILDSQETDLEKIDEKLKIGLMRLLCPKAASRESTIIQILQMGDSIVYSMQNGKTYTVQWKPDLAEDIIARIQTGLDNEVLLEIAKQFYQNFWPQEVRELMVETDILNLTLALDSRLIGLPWELSYGEEQFLFKRFCFSRKVLPIENKERSDSLMKSPRLFLLVDDSKEAQNIKRAMLKTFEMEFPKIRLQIAKISDSAFEIVQKIAKCDIFHVISPMVYNEKVHMDSGWPLIEKKMLKLRFLENAPKKPKVLFCQSTQNSTTEICNFTSLLYKLGVHQTVGTFWNADNEELVLTFYRNLYKGLTVEKAIQKTKEHLEKDLKTSLSLFLYGHSGKSLISNV